MAPNASVDPVILGVAVGESNGVKVAGVERSRHGELASTLSRACLLDQVALAELDRHAFRAGGDEGFLGLD